jgi:hypothetical protein
MGLRIAICCLALGATVLAGAPAAQAADANDNFAAAAPLVVGQVDEAHDNTGATTEPNEDLTATGAVGRQFCDYGAGETSQANKTLWWTVVGTGRNMRVDTYTSPFDTHLAIFGSTLTSAQLCADDRSDFNEAIEFQSTAGQVYHVQVGGCASHTGLICGDSDGVISLFANSAEVNDNRAQAAVLPTGVQTAGDNYVATEEPGEPTVCASERGMSEYGRTVWYRWSTAVPGQAIFTANDFDTVLAVLPSGSNTPLACNDDSNAAGPSRIALQVTPGTYFVQVGGYQSTEGAFHVLAEFTENNDRDGDGSTNAQDCQPDNPAVHPGAVDVPGNGIDEDCSGADATPPPPPPPNPDRDGDGTLNAADCQPDNPAVHPGAVDVPGNAVDEDCSGGPAPYPDLSSTPAVSWITYPTYWTITAVKVTRVPSGVRIEVRCIGGRARGCRFTRVSRTTTKSSAAVTITTRAIRRLRLRRGATLEVRVTKPATIGVVRRYVFSRRNKAPRIQDRCLPPGATTPLSKC